MTVEELIQRLAAEVPAHRIDPDHLPDDEDEHLYSYAIVSELYHWLVEHGDAPETEPAYAVLEDAFRTGEAGIGDLLVIELFEGRTWPPELLARMGPATRHARWLHGIAMNAFTGEAGHDDVDAVARTLQNAPRFDSAGALHVLGASRATRHRGLVERALHDEDPATATEALRVLCLYWEETERYAAEALDALRAGPRERRVEAALLIGRHLRSHTNDVLLAALLERVEDRDDDPDVRNAAHHALGQATGKPEWYAPTGIEAPPIAAGERAPEDERVRLVRSRLRA